MNTRDGRDRIKEVNLVARELGISPYDAERINADQFRSVADSAYQQGRGGPVGRNTGTVAPQNDRENLIQKMRDTHASDHGKPLPTRMNLEEVRSNWEKLDRPPVATKTTEASDASVSSPEDGRWEQFEICDGATITVWVK